MVYQVGARATQQLLSMANMTPTTQRIIIAATGIVSHTTIDALNPLVDKKTRKLAAIKSAIKVFVGGVSGIATRALGQKLGEWAVKSGKVILPKDASFTEAAFATSVGKVFAIAGAIAGIFLMDVPFTNKFLNMIMSKINGKKDNTETKKVDLNA